MPAGSGALQPQAGAACAPHAHTYGAPQPQADPACAHPMHTCLQVRDTIRKQIITMVLATDMKQHFSHTSLFK